jgi:hypothetical protein
VIIEDVVSEDRSEEGGAMSIICTSPRTASGPLRDRTARTLVTVTLGAILLAGAVSLATPSGAAAASRISACFYYNGYWWKGLSTIIEYQTVSGGWRYLPGSNGYTGSQGCATYNISGRYRQWHLREVAFGQLKVGPDRLGVFLGTSRYYAPSGLQRANLGTRQLSLYTFPAPSGYDGLTSSWMQEMSGSGQNCSSSAAMQVACWEDQQGIHGDIVVVPVDSDHDGVYDDVDAFPHDKYRSR